MGAAQHPTPRAPRPIVLPSASHAATLAAVILTAVYFGQTVLVPLALAVLLSFVLSPLVVGLRKYGAPRALAVALVMAALIAAVTFLGMAMARQVTELANDLPRYESTLRQKLKSVRTGVTQSGVIDRATATLKGLSKEIEPQSAPSTAPTPSPSTEGPRPIPVVIHTPPERLLDTYQRIVSVLLAPITTVGIVLILIVFILMQREDIRDRVIRLVGPGDIELTTTALNDAAFRLSRLFLAQTAMNAAFGAVVALGLWAIGVPSPLLWGIIAGLMRFIPYIGAVLAAVFPLLLAAAVDPGWTMAAWTLALYLILEPVVGHLIEPWVQGQSTGLSPLAIVISAILWTALWGPIGLLLATPLTMCLVVLGRHVQGLAFLDVVLGDQPALSPPEVFYQRMLAGNAAEATDQAQQFLKTSSLMSYYETVALSGLTLAAQDAQRRVIDEERMLELRAGVALLIEDLSDASLDSAAPDDAAEKITPEAPRTPVLTPDELKQDWRTQAPVLCLATRTSIDAAAADILAELLRRHGIGARAASVTRLSELGGLDLDGVRAIWISSMATAESNAQIRYVVRRLQRLSPSIILCVGAWDGSANTAPDNSGSVHHASGFAAAVETTSALARLQTGTPESRPRPQDVHASTEVAREPLPAS